MVDRSKAIRVLLVVYFVASIAIAVPLVFYVSDAGNLSGTTSGKVLAAAVVAMGIGALRAARDPWRQRLVVQVLIVFTALAACAVIYRLAAEHHHHDPAWLVLPFAIAAPALLGYFYPRPEKTGSTGDDRRADERDGRPDAT